ncbi:histidine phosphatase family protein [Primorskyibacter aestuariivivens]|uniref:histidine phosphatase family protein n=1 Tax=Primorskyibacter aestuariivivens TaxID=1888912 RepID=UPI002300F58E|nr:histidine phosphatase family protein [Primorskyibacter aestuariivivens]MDA7428003.1 histidine phosphatase family protein [Primorskyibacter aestuariivivens]
MTGPQPTELTLIRHAPVKSDGRAYGRRDVDADCSDAARFEAMRARLGPPGRVLHSPARRCVQTLQAIWPDAAGTPEAAFWEQDLGDWEDRPYADLPDLGPLSRAALAAYRPENGESFDDLCARVAPALNSASQGGSAVIIAHAGTIRAALGLALEAQAAALAFEIAPLSITRLGMLSDGTLIIRSVNETA